MVVVKGAECWCVCGCDDDDDDDFDDDVLSVGVDGYGRGCTQISSGKSVQQVNAHTREWDHRICRMEVIQKCTG